MEHPSNIDLAAIKRKLADYQQQHVLQFWDDLQTVEKEKLAKQLQDIDFATLKALVSGEDKSVDFGELASRAQAPPSVRADGSGAAWDPREALERGEAAVKAGEVAVLIVAGGQGTRLGFDQPKGMFPIGPVSNRTLFEFFADNLKAIERRYGKRVPLLLMTSPATDAETRTYLKDNNYLGLSPDQVHVFCQGTMPAVDAETGKLLLETKSSLALSPDGHGGTVAALSRNGLLDMLRQAGVKQLFYAQVDNPLVKLCDPSFLGHHLMAGSDMTTLVIRKRYPTERVGNVVLVDGRVQIIEYSDLPDAAAEAKTAEGGLKLWAGNIAVHVFEVDFLTRAAADPERLPFHRANKKVPFVDSKGNTVEPDSPNAIKFERFIFDLLPSAENAFVVEGTPAEVFAPVKNADGAATDTPNAAKQQIVDLHKGWLEAAGVKVADGVQVEINSQLALDEGEVARMVEEGRLLKNGSTITEDTYLS